MATPSLVDLDFDDIRNELKSFLQNQSEFNDYDFDGSGLSVLLDVLAYNTQMNAMMAHLSLNESFLNTAQVRPNVVSHAQLLGYVPRSITSSFVEIDMVVTGDGLSPNTLTLPRGFTFSGTINNITYTFVVFSSQTVTKSVTNTYTFTNVLVYEGSIKTERFNVDSLVEFQKFELNSNAVDTSTISVTVFANAADTLGTVYERFSNIAQATSETNIYFIQENPFGRYDVYFGDGNIGNKPANGSIVEVSYIETSGEAANNITSLAANSDLGGISNIVTTFSSGFTKTSGGAPQESIESVRYNAPLINSTQDRAVTANDYASLLLANFTELSDVSVWGGEEANPPVYGKVFITPALNSGEQPTEAFKTSLINFLKTKNIGSILPEIVDPEYTYVQLFVGVKYDTNRSLLTSGELETLTRSVVDTYDATELNKFSGVLRQSELLARIDDADDGIVSSVITPTLYKNFSPDPTQQLTYTIDFPVELYLKRDSTYSIDSTPFNISSTTAKLGDEAIEGTTTQRRLFFYDTLTGNKLDGYTDVGTINSNGAVIINAIQFDTANSITIFVTPNSYDIAPKYNQLLQILSEDVTVSLVQDTISANGLSGTSDYQTFTKF